MKYIVIALLILMGNLGIAQEFYDLKEIQTIEITFEESNWDVLLDAQKNGAEEYIMAQSISINGTVLDSVGVKYKGNSTYQANQVKNPFHIELDTYKDHQYEAYTDIKLSNVAKDPSFLREVLSYQVLRQYMAAPLSNYANVYVNGELIGLYSNSEAVSKKFVNSRFYSKKNTFIKCNPPAGAGPQTDDFPNLVYLGQDSTDYYAAYELKSDNGWQDLIDLCNTLNNNFVDIEKVLDVDKVLWMLAFNNVLVNLDSYSGSFAQNYYLYKDDYGRFLPVVWDLNESFGQFSNSGAGRLRDTRSKQELTHLLHENSTSYPLIQKLLSDPTYKRMYLAHMKTILQENFENGAYEAVAQSLQTLIANDVNADNNKFFGYDEFLSNLTEDITTGGGPMGNSTPGITNLMNGRAGYLLGLTDFTQQQPSISAIETSTPTPLINDELGITATIANGNQVILGYRAGIDGPFTKVQMYDDGAHGDGAAGDGVYGTDFVISSTSVQYYIYAENDDIGMFSPQRAEHEYHTISATTPDPVLGDLVINEFMASNSETVADQDGEFDDWIELYNNGATAIALEGYALSDDANELSQYTFPAGTTIQPGGYLIVWADNDIDQDGLHAPFRLSAAAETIYLSDASGTIIDEVSYVDQASDVSTSRIPNGTGDFQATPISTFNGNNGSVLDCSNNGGDADDDGICADEDCDDTDASIGAKQDPGTGCDDGDANTINDVILADGCSCKGFVTVSSDLVINEFMTSNDETAADQDGEFDDWIELYNNGAQAIDLEGYVLTDNGADLEKFVFPAGTTIGANAYLIIWADGDIDQEGLHADFRLSAIGETLLLINASGNLIDEVSYGEQVTDVSYGRFPNGTGEFRKMPPTFNAENSGMSNTAELAFAEVTLSVFPNPAHKAIHLESNSKLAQVSLYTLAGEKLQTEKTHGHNHTMDISTWEDGIYLLKIMTADQVVRSSKVLIAK